MANDVTPVKDDKEERVYFLFRLPATHLLPGVGDGVALGEVHLLAEDSAGGVAERQTGAISGNPVCVGHHHAACGAVPREHHVVVLVDLRRCRKGHQKNQRRLISLEPMPICISV